MSIIETAQPENKVKVTGVQKVTGEISLSEADIVVSGGRGLKGPENWGLVTELAELLGAALIQSKQTWLPVLSEPITVAQFIDKHPSSQKLIAHCEEGNKTTLTNIPNSNDTSILIGPEGDFTPSEITLAIDAKYTPVSLGETRLRTETAGMVAAALLLYKN